MAEVFDLESIKKKMLRKYPAFGATISSVKYQIVSDDSSVDTAATDGKTIYVNVNFLSSLPENEQVFVFAHEVCHIALKHISRSKGKNQKLWNIATDGVINQHLMKDGLKMPKGCVDIADALSYDAEELYEKLLKDREQQGETGQQENQQGQKGEDNQVGHDDHSMWQEAVKREEQKQEKEKTEGKEKEEQTNEAQESQEISEKQVFEKNEEEKIKRAEEVMQKIKGTSRGLDGKNQVVYFDDIGKADKAVVNWKKLLVRALDKEDEAWGRKFSDKSNGYAVRIEDVEYEEKAETEIILDTSGSVSVDLLRNFLRQVKMVLKNSTIKVGTFSDSFHGFVEIKKESDIDSLRIRVGGGTNFDAASKAFTKRKDVNKICFTDGCDGGNAGIKDKRKDIVWISFENPKFKPDNGKVLYVPEEKINLDVENQNEPKMTR